MRIAVLGATGNAGTSLLRTLADDDQVTDVVGIARRFRPSPWELGWSPRHSSAEALRDLLDGLHDRAGMDTPPLRPDTGGPLRVRELLTGVGGTSR